MRSTKRLSHSTTHVQAGTVWLAAATFNTGLIGAPAGVVIRSRVVGVVGAASGKGMRRRGNGHGQAESRKSGKNYVSHYIYLLIRWARGIARRVRCAVSGKTRATNPSRHDPALGDWYALHNGHYRSFIQAMIVLPDRHARTARSTREGDGLSDHVPKICRTMARVCGLVLCSNR
jgi:hypothetical protein